MNKKILIPIIVIICIILVLVIVKKIREQKTETGPSGEFEEFSPGDYDFSLIHDGLTRKYRVHLPPSYDKSKATPVVIYLHGGGGSIKAAYLDGIDKYSDKFGFILVVPAGTGKLFNDRLLVWNGGRWQGGECCGYAVENNIDDVGFISKMIEELKKKFNVDEKRIYATGISNGGLMSYRLACELSEKIAAIAPVAPPAVPQDCSPSKPIPVMHIHGTADPCARFNGGRGGGCLGGKIFFDGQSAEKMVDSWLKRNNCANESTVIYQKGNATCISYQQCKDESEVEFCTIQEGGHTWPSGSQYLPPDRIGHVSYDISFDQIWEFFKRHPIIKTSTNYSEPSLSQPVCGDGLCGKTETKTSCPQDCDELTCRELYKTTEQICLNKGWKKVKIDVNGIEREMLWKAPQTWKYGAIIVMHGGEGVDSNFCSSTPRIHNPLLSEILRGVPAEEFGELAVKEGFAVFSLNSAYNRVTDAEGRPVGKRWDSLAQEGKDNIDLPFIEKVIDEVIPSMRSSGSSISIFMTGISNGGFTTILASTHFPDKITAFAPVSAGDPYGTYFDMSVKGPRKCGPGVWRDSETNKEIREPNACVSDNYYLNEMEWPQTKKSIPFKQFHNKGDDACDISCMQKVRKLLVEYGYKDEGAFIIDHGKRSIEEHFWQREYNQPIIDFFKRHSIK